MHLVALIISVVLLVGCGKREDLRPAPTSSIAKSRAFVDALAWVGADPAQRSHKSVADSGSMAPMMDSRSVLLLERVSGPDLKAGDIAIYDAGGKSICHRVRLVSQTAVLFTGDNNDQLRPDGWITHDRIRWRVAGILFTKR